MGTWDKGPFDNDTAADWCGDLNDMDQPARVEAIRSTLEVAASNDDYLDSDEAAEAIAAAALVASHRPGGSPITSPYAPDFLLAGQVLDLDGDLPELALRALDRILADRSEWRELWVGAGVAEFPEIDRLRVVLSVPPELPGQMTLL